ncbi:GNAT family N-acetyltransferase [Parvularcula lutaonensis]|uniref:GNAT family N-acetyltransferase n=1 Tax=Parvularcula lutaonensis TaxID=491923 RepID=A0ABV7MAR8_9PROT|nr:GNAT family N-acetyltransferase [Parvularcula lutaonensis]
MVDHPKTKTRRSGRRRQRGLPLNPRLAFRRQREAALPPTADPRQLDLVAEIIEEAKYSHGEAFLAFTGDKRFVFSDSGRSFIMFAPKGRARIAMADPVGFPEEFPELEAKFIDIARKGRGWPAFYSVSEETADRHRSHGFSAEKIGERAVVDLSTFSLSGKGKKDLRNSRNKAIKAGCRFVVHEENAPDELIASLKPVSDAWLEMKSGAEKTFSLGRFDPDYLRRFRLAVVYREDTPVAFANVWSSKGLVTMDLMRFRDDGPGGGMDYLFTELALWAQNEGFEELDLGLAPLAGLEDRKQDSLLARLGTLAYQHGRRFYNFDGLRTFKDKFDPVWHPAYIVAGSPWRIAAAVVAVAALTGGGLRGNLKRARKRR